MVSEKSFILLMVSSTTPFFTVLAIIFGQDCSLIKNPKINMLDFFLNVRHCGIFETFKNFEITSFKKAILDWWNIKDSLYEIHTETTTIHKNNETNDKF